MIKKKGGEIIKIIECFNKGKINQQLCEDMYYISEDFVVIADGVTSKSDFSYEEKSTGKIAAEIIISSFDKISKNATSNEILSIINNEINDFYKKVEFPYPKNKMGLQAACVIYSHFYREIWIIGDCQASVDGKVYLNPKKSDTILAEVRSLSYTFVV